VAATIFAIYITKSWLNYYKNLQLGNACLALLLGAVELLLGLIYGRVSAEQVDGEHLVCFPLLVSDVGEPLQLHERLRALLVALVEVAGQGDQ